VRLGFLKTGTYERFFQYFSFRAALIDEKWKLFSKIFAKSWRCQSKIGFDGLSKLYISQFLFLKIPKPLLL
jgi:hypothetical protein